MGLSGARDRNGAGATALTPAQAAAMESQRCQAALTTYRRNDADVARVDGLMPIIDPAATNHNVDPRMLAAIALRESGGRNIPERGGGGGAGVFQLTNKPPAVMARAYDIPFAANYAATMLAQNMHGIKRKFSNISNQQQTQADAAAYNHGLKK